jgi:hypothetical protein
MGYITEQRAQPLWAPGHAPGAPLSVRAFVTKVNSFSSAFDHQQVPAVADGRVDAGVEVAGVGRVIIAGGAVPVVGASDPHNPKSWHNFKKTVLRYDVDARQITDLSVAPSASVISIGRAFMATTPSNRQVAPQPTSNTPARTTPSARTTLALSTISRCCATTPAATSALRAIRS